MYLSVGLVHVAAHAVLAVGHGRAERTAELVPRHLVVGFTPV